MGKNQIGDNAGRSNLEKRIPGENFSQDEKRAMREAGIKQCRGCKQYKILYKGGYCKECRNKWMAEKGFIKSGNS